MRHEGQPVSRTAILEQVWKLNFDTMTNVVDVYINYLRRKMDSGYDRARRPLPDWRKRPARLEIRIVDHRAPKSMINSRLLVSVITCKEEPLALVWSRGVAR